MREDANISPADKINWKLTLQGHIERCLFFRDLQYLEDFEKQIDDLRCCLYYDLRGLPFRTRIREAEDELLAWYNRKMKDFKEDDSRDYYNPIRYHQTTRPWRFQKADALFEFLTQLIAEHEGLFGTQRPVETWKENEGC